MKKLLLLICALFVGGTAWTRADVEVSLDFFYDNLEPHGDWVEVADYGYAWHPRDVAEDWRPYRDGSWAHTDAGWTWVSDEPYGWAVYHYGRWTRAENVGWVWIPGTEWGPAWVSWRKSERHVGWAPLPPEAHFERSRGFAVSIDAEFDIGPDYYNFVEVRNFGAPRLSIVLIQPRENITIIHETRNITRINYVNNIVINNGPDYDVMARQSAQPLRQLRLERRADILADRAANHELRTQIQGDALQIPAPAFKAAAANTAPKKVVKKIAKTEIDRGWKNAGPPDQVAKLRKQLKEEAAAPATTADAPATAPTEDPAITAKNKKGGKGKDVTAAVLAPATPADPAAAPATTATAPPVATPSAPDPADPLTGRPEVVRAKEQKRAEAEAKAKAKNKDTKVAKGPVSTVPEVPKADAPATPAPNSNPPEPKADRSVPTEPAAAPSEEQQRNRAKARGKKNAAAAPPPASATPETAVNTPRPAPSAENAPARSNRAERVAKRRDARADRPVTAPPNPQAQANRQAQAQAQANQQAQAQRQAQAQHAAQQPAANPQKGGKKGKAKPGQKPDEEAEQ